MHVSLRTAKTATALGIALATVAVTGAAASAAPVSPVAAGAARVSPAAATASSPWSQTDYNAALSRANLTEQTLTAATVGHIGYLRSVTAPPSPGFCGENVPSQGIVAPLLTGGDLYAATNGRITKYNAATGAIIWRRNPDPTFSTLYESLAVAGGLVVVGELDCGSVSSPAGTIQAFSATTGAKVWSRPMDRFDDALQTLVVTGGLVVAAGSSAFGLVVTVHKLATGAMVWARGANCLVNPPPLMVVGQVVITPGSCATTGSIIARNLTTGATLWTRTGNWVLQRGDSDTTAGRHVFAIDPTGTAVSLDPLTGKTQYSLAGAASVLAVDASQAYGACGTNSVDVCAYDSTTGSQRWQVEPFNSPFPTLAAEAGGVLYLDKGDALDTATGKELTALGGGFPTPATALAVGDGRVAAVTDPRVIDLYGLPGS